MDTFIIHVITGVYVPVMTLDTHLAYFCHYIPFSLRLREFNRSQVLDFNPYDNGDNVQSHSTGTGPGLGQRLSIDDIREQQKSIIAGDCHVTNCHVNNCFFL